MRAVRLRLLFVMLAGLVGGCGDDRNDKGRAPGRLVDPGSADWVLVPRAEVAETCQLDAALLDAIDQTLNVPWGLVRHGRLCHEFYPRGAAQIEERQETFGVTRTFAALVTGMVVHETRNYARRGAKSGPISDLDRVDYWLDAFSFNPDAQLAHVLAMVAHNPSLGFGEKQRSDDADGRVQVNRIKDMVSAALAQDPERLGWNLEEFTQRFLYTPLGMRHSTWTNGSPNKNFATSWASSIRDMLRVGLLMLNDGMWSGRRIVDAEWIYKMTHPAFEDADTGYGYLTWLSARSNYLAADGSRAAEPRDACLPAAIYREFPHGLSEAPDCGYANSADCAQRYDVGVWYAMGDEGQLIVGMKGLDLVIAIQDFGSVSPAADAGSLWRVVRKALVARDPTYAGDEAAFCAAYGRNEYAPDRR